MPDIKIPKNFCGNLADKNPDITKNQDRNSVYLRDSLSPIRIMNFSISGFLFSEFSQNSRDFKSQRKATQFSLKKPSSQKIPCGSWGSTDEHNFNYL